MKKSILILGLTALTSGGQFLSAQVGINTDTPKTTLDIVQKDTANVKGQGFRLIDGNEGNRKVLTSDADGTGTWRNIAVNMITGVVPMALNRQIDLCTHLDDNLMAIPEVYIDLPQGQWLVIHYLPFSLNFELEANGLMSVNLRVLFSPLLSGATGTDADYPSTLIIKHETFFSITNEMGEFAREMFAVVINNPNAGITRYYLQAGLQRIRKTTGLGMSWRNSGICDALPAGASAYFGAAGTAGTLYAIPNSL
ncbi:MAG: hypothetical protein LBS01_07815 [Prevotellaceae bacterium]|jgi:hypothetical protein|nr:hypothetical protein [Prevotellaceae bacterium]